jgi:DNA modification methylase
MSQIDPEHSHAQHSAGQEQSQQPEAAPAPKIDPRNKLNDLTGREWTYALRSVIATRYPTSGPESYEHRQRRAHPSPKPPQLLAELVRFFTKPGQLVLDPFCGVGGTLLACALEGRSGVGIELSPMFAQIYHDVATQLELAPQPVVVGDARQLLSYPAVAGQMFDLILTDPPYAAMMARPKTGERKKRGNGQATPFTSDAADLGNLEYPAFLSELCAILELALQRLKPRGYLVLFTKDLQPTREHHNMLHADIVSALARVPQLSYRGYRIWHDMSQNLYPFGYPFAFVANQVHQFILVFRKEVEPG